ncbi:MAG: undecaprenyl diphosphate synthase family protein [Candidatus Peribacteria bacterium]|nr:MAG: undecaprenyl diphosphate synthase family protein [Candidatus Peribacteria bacterium]
MMKIFFENTFDQEINDFLRENHINYRRIGNPVGIDNELVQAFHDKMAEHHYPDSDRTMCIAINYGGRDEIIRAIHTYITNGHRVDELSEQTFEHYLDTYGLPPLDLVIRTKAHLAQRLSGFMSRQTAYAELYFTETLFPDLGPEELQKALYRFNDIAVHRNFGK